MKWVRCLSVFVLLLAVGCSSSSASHSEFVKLDGITYVGMGDMPSTLTDADLTFYQTVKRRHWPAVRDGDSVQLGAGTSIYSIAGYTTSFRLATKGERGIVIYQAELNPEAQKGGDLLDLGQKVEEITITGSDGRRLGTITDTAKLDELVSMILEAPISAANNPGTQMVALTFNLVDGTFVRKFFWIDSAVLGPPDILLPVDFSIAVGEAINAQRQRGNSRRGVDPP